MSKQRWSIQQDAPSHSLSPSSTSSDKAASSLPAPPGAHLGLQPASRSYRPFPTSLFDYVFVPFGILFGIIPLLQAQIFQIFTDRLTYKVSLKPQSAARKGGNLVSGSLA